MHKTRASITAQLSLIKKAERTGKAFDEVLERAGWTYDDLIYKRSRTKAWAGPPPLRLEELRSDRHHAPVVSFFTGSGGMDLGLEAAGYRHVAAFEINEVFCKTLRRNRPRWKVFGPPTHPGDISRFDEISEVLGGVIRTPFEGLFVGCPPCPAVLYRRKPALCETRRKFQKGWVCAQGKWKPVLRFCASDRSLSAQGFSNRECARA